MSLRDAWEAQAGQWIRWVRSAEHDVYWGFRRDEFLRVLPPPGRLTVDIGCGEGRLARHLKTLGHRVIAVDSSPTLVAAAREADPAMDVRLGDATALPIEDAIADLAIGYMLLHSIDAIGSAVREAVRVLAPGGKLCLAIVHPMASTKWSGEMKAGASVTLTGDYFTVRDMTQAFKHEGLTITLFRRHRPLESYFLALEEAGFVVEALREPDLPDAAAPQADRRPRFLHIRASLVGARP